MERYSQIKEKGINRAQSAGIIIEIVKEKKDIQKIYNIIYATYKKVGFLSQILAY